MDQKNIEALTYGPEHLLSSFVNLPVSLDESDAAEEFRERYGELYPGLNPGDYWGYVQILRQAWTARKKNEIEAVGMHLQRIFEREPGLPTTLNSNHPHWRPAITVDYSTGTIGIKPRTLLDFLAAYLLALKDRLAICEREECPQPYYVRIHARQHFCSPGCANSVRKVKKQAWWDNNRERFIEKWRTQRKTNKKQKSAARRRSKSNGTLETR